MTTKYYIYNTKTHEVVDIPDDIDGRTWISLSEERYGDKYQYPAIYNMDSHTVLDQSDGLSRQGDWIMVSEASTASPVPGVPDSVTGIPNDNAYSSESVARLYSAAFRRAPDESGLKYWTEMVNDPQTSFKSVAQSFIDSAEFSDLVPSSSSDEEFCSALYQNVLGRAPESSGLEFWTVHLGIGLFNRADVLCGLAESPENISLTESIA